MDRERKLLYVIAVLAPIVETMTLATWHYESDFPNRETLMQETRDCQKQLVRAWARCASRHLCNPREL